jgi:26S proteasome regulatory subunit N8
MSKKKNTIEIFYCKFFFNYFRDIKDTSVGSLSQRITNQLMGLKGLHSHITDINSYLQKVSSGQLPVNHQIIYQLQDVFNLLPDVNLQDFVTSVYVKTNDQMLVVYLASLIRSVIALHNLISNKVQNRDTEKNEGKDLSKEKKDIKKDDKEGEKKDSQKDKGKTSEKSENKGSKSTGKK